MANSWQSLPRNGDSLLDQTQRIKAAGVCAVIVTYGDRFALVEAVVHGTLASGVGKIIVVDNGCAGASAEALRQLVGTKEDSLEIVRLAENRGSAAGFKAGIERALSRASCEYIWLLDDDNRPTADALDQLLSHFEQLSRTVPRQGLALQCLREQWLEHQRLASGAAVRDVFPRKSSFMGFHLLTPPGIWRRFFEVRSSSGADSRATQSAVEIPFGPYGGFFAHREAFARLGLPDERFFLYNDDIEYTTRFVSMGGKLFLILTSAVRDLVPSWHTRTRGETLFSHYLLSDSDSRAYFAMRNQSYLETHVFGKNPLAYFLNKAVFFVFLVLGAVLLFRCRRLALIVRAVRNGRLGKLGPAEI